MSKPSGEMVRGNMHTMYAVLFILLAVFQAPVFASKKSYIVYLGGHSHGNDVTDADLEGVSEGHTELLSSFVGSKEEAESAIIYSYTRHINGFSALLDEDQAAQLRNHPGVVSVFLDKPNRLHTSHSWEFLNLERNGFVHRFSIWKQAKYGEGAIIANLDTGAWPESKSFNGRGFGPIPAKWKGVCDFNKENATKSLCNNKLIGARYFSKGFIAINNVSKDNATYNTARDTEGHGSHTLSTVGGNFVPGASIFGFANGTVKGGSPKARVASYKVCWPPVGGDGECYDSDIMKAVDYAISDGVDVLSASLGGPATDFFNDGIAIAAFEAVKKGIAFVASAGNSGPYPYTVTNVAPWIITVGASTIDREFEANVELGNGTILQGTSMSGSLPGNRSYTLIASADAKASNASADEAQLCQLNSLDPNKAKGKIVVCTRGVNARVEKGLEARRAGAAGFVLANDRINGDSIVADAHVIPAAHIGYNDGITLFSYINATKNPQGWLTPPSVRVNMKPSPVVASFSSRGPNTITPEILKPDISAPGVDIIAAYTEAESPTESELDSRRTPYITMSGTSMSCPHVSGVVGLIKSLHPDWTPAAIRSAIMTTASTRDNTFLPIIADGFEATGFDYGAGEIHPNRAADPGLVYDLSVNDYLDFLCGLNYSSDAIRLFSGSEYDCPTQYSTLDFNNPAFSIPRLNGTVRVRRSVTNVVGGGKVSFKARIRNPPGYSVSVQPSTLNFEETGEVKVFHLVIESLRASNNAAWGHLVWDEVNGRRSVKSPIVVTSSTSKVV